MTNKNIKKYLQKSQRSGAKFKTVDISVRVLQERYSHDMYCRKRGEGQQNRT